MNELFGTLCMTQMVLDGLPTSTIQFFNRIYPYLATMKSMSTRKMAELSYMAPQSASAHRDRLVAKGYLRRHHYRAWYLNEFVIRDPKLLQLLKKVAA